MLSKNLSRTFVLGAFGTLLCGVSTAAVAQSYNNETEQVIVRPDTFVEKKQLMGRHKGALNPVMITVSRRINTSDLDLRSGNDFAELEHRIHNTARAVCREVDRQATPFTSDLGGRNCVKDATDQAMLDVRDILADRAG